MNRVASGKNLALGAALLWAVAGVAVAADLPKAETVIDRFVEATGGKAVWESRHNEISTGAIEMVGKGIKGTFAVYAAEPAKQTMEMEIEGIGKLQEGTDGVNAWSVNAFQGPRLKEGVEKTSSLREARFNSELHWRDIYKRAEIAGVETVDGKDCYKVVMTPDDGSPVNRYYEKQSGLLVKASTVAKGPMGDIPTETIFSDYRKEGALLMAHKILMKAGGMDMTMTVESVKTNTDIPASKLDPPAEIKPLIKAAPAAGTAAPGK